ncbi:hypothetical protein KQI84_15145 [bacterium]|nr:hypothetical protein [bacterium]
MTHTDRPPILKQLIPWGLMILIAFGLGSALVLGIFAVTGGEELPTKVVHHQVGMTKHTCHTANGMPDYAFDSVTEAQAANLDFHPAPPNTGREGSVEVYSFTTFAIFMYYDENDVCFFVHVGTT